MSRFYLSGGFGNILFQYVGVSYIKDFSNCFVSVDKILINNNFITKHILKWKIHENNIDFLFEKFNVKNNKNYLGLFFLYFSRLLKRPFFLSVYQDTYFNKIYLNMNFYQVIIKTLIFMIKVVQYKVM